MERFFAITTVFNPAGSESRYKGFSAFEARMKASGVNLFVIECAFGDAPFAVTSAKNPFHIQLRSKSILWIRENLINICVSKLPTNWKYMAWIDSDVEFENPDWVCECVKELNKNYRVVQLFEECDMLDKTGAVMAHVPGFAYKHVRGTFSAPASPDLRAKSKGNKDTFNFKNELGDGKEAGFGEPGFAWAICRDAYETLGGLVDFAITGPADNFMAYSFIGQLSQATTRIKNREYLECLQTWEKKAADAIRKNIGYVKGNIKHHYTVIASEHHCQERDKILNECNFNPKTDIKKDLQGVYQLVNPASKLSQRLYQYFINCYEDK